MNYTTTVIIKTTAVTNDGNEISVEDVLDFETCNDDVIADTADHQENILDLYLIEPPEEEVIEQETE
jgi:hypothetical protein